MRPGRMLRIVFLLSILAAGCSKLPGLQVLTGQDAASVASTDRTVQALDLVMADKTGGTDPGMLAAAYRIETADPVVDIIEMRKDEASRVFVVNMLFAPPDGDTNTAEGQIAFLESVRRAFELTWQGMMQPSEGTDQIVIRLLGAGSIPTLDHGASYMGYLLVEATIDRAAAAKYLAGARNLSNFYNLILDGALNYQPATDFIVYEGTPNHPMFMLPASSITSG